MPMVRPWVFVQMPPPLTLAVPVLHALAPTLLEPDDATVSPLIVNAPTPDWPMARPWLFVQMPPPLTLAVPDYRYTGANTAETRR